MVRTRAGLAAVSIGLATLSASAQGPGTANLPPPFPRVNAARLLDAPRINVWRVVWPNGQPTALHRHIYDQIGTYYARGGRIITTPDGQARTTTTEVGSLSNTRKGTTHIEAGNTDPPLRAVFIELKQDTASGVPPADVGAAVFPRAGAKQVQDDERVTIWDTSWESGDKGFAYRAPVDTVIVWLGAGRLRSSGGPAGTTTVDVDAGTMRYLERGSSEALEMIAGAPRVLLFQLK